MVMKLAIIVAVPSKSINKIPPSSTTDLQPSPKVHYISLGNPLAYQSHSGSLIARCLSHHLDCRTSCWMAKSAISPDTANAYLVMALSEKSIRIHAVETLVRYRFHNPALLWEALQGPSIMIDIAGERVPPDGNKQLAIVGDAVMQLVLAETWYPGKTNKGKVYCH